MISGVPSIHPRGTVHILSPPSCSPKDGSHYPSLQGKLLLEQTPRLTLPWLNKANEHPSHFSDREKGETGRNTSSLADGLGPFFIFHIGDPTEAHWSSGLLAPLSFWRWSPGISPRLGKSSMAPDGTHPLHSFCNVKSLSGRLMLVPYPVFWLKSHQWILSFLPPKSEKVVIEF